MTLSWPPLSPFQDQVVMNSEFQVWALLFCVATGILGVLLNKVVQELARIRSRLARFVKIGDFFTKNGPKLIKYAGSLDEILAGGNKINEDSVKINHKMLEEFVKMRDLVEKMNLVMFPEAASEQPRTPQDVQRDYHWNIKKMIDEGIDPENAKRYASDAEWEQIFVNGVGPDLGVTGSQE